MLVRRAVRSLRRPIKSTRYSFKSTFIMGSSYLIHYDSLVRRLILQSLISPASFAPLPTRCQYNCCTSITPFRIPPTFQNTNPLLCQFYIRLKRIRTNRANNLNFSWSYFKTNTFTTRTSLQSVLFAIARVLVSVHPLIQVPNQLVGAPTNTDVALQCHVEASPKAINYWTRENGTVRFNVRCSLMIMKLRLSVGFVISACISTTTRPDGTHHTLCMLVCSPSYHTTNHAILL